MRVVQKVHTVVVTGFVEEVVHDGEVLVTKEVCVEPSREEVVVRVELVVHPHVEVEDQKSVCVEPRSVVVTNVDESICVEVGG